MKRKLLITADGDVLAVYDDRLVAKQLLARLGNPVVQRASNVEFNNEDKLWEARDLSGVVIARGPNRDDVLAQEKAIIEQQLIHKNNNTNYDFGYSNNRTK